MIIKSKHFLVIGTAMSGIAVTRFLLSKDAYVILTDVKSKEKLNKEILEFEKRPNFRGIYGTQPPLSILEKIDYIIASPGVPFNIPIIQKAKKQNIEILSEIELAYRLSNTPIIAITGTNGKTTTTILVGEIFKKSKKKSYVVGNIGIPMISKIEEADENGYFIAEVSSFQLEGTKYFKPHISVILNITPDHLNRHETMENYIYEKSKIFLNQNYEDITILNADDPITFSLREKTKGKVVLFSSSSLLEEGVFIENNEIVIKNNMNKIKVCSISDIKMLGKHNLENALAAVAVAYHAQIPVNNIKKILQTFKGVNHRIEVVDIIDGIEFINDSKGTNPEASIRAIEAMKKPIVLIAGGMDKGTDFSNFVGSFKGKVRHLIVLGETADIISKTAKEQGFFNITKVEDLSSAVITSFEKAHPGDVVLLSPACASWDMFRSFEERGDLFKNIVKSLRGGEDGKGKTC
ncbi:UDP-N-acetylmuramoyl-L-alanine--D-glutamate ligase [Garciella nitratireducens]|uniref:UDP-N-acetylmuramoyl-L-alanine--D-glutamate ligase n=1 Tax=Garciella nitratireducens TaxID=218205 RepID=UPI000DEACC98|nr:UDP-N-acetylmuramoyl-L-alanine--D-glutamate ligase [Garciella nitratireducens]RBP45554.1 UDP-N-acetylmuramoylalanine--D-glutamate ligase [Garciella nitratireducens]